MRVGTVVEVAADFWEMKLYRHVDIGGIRAVAASVDHGNPVLGSPIIVSKADTGLTRSTGQSPC